MYKPFVERALGLLGVHCGKVMNDFQLNRASSLKLSDAARNSE